MTSNHVDLKECVQPVPHKINSTANITEILCCLYVYIYSFEKQQQPSIQNPLYVESFTYPYSNMCTTPPFCMPSRKISHYLKKMFSPKQSRETYT